MSHDILEYDGGPFGAEVPSEVLFTSKLFSAADAASIIPEPLLSGLLRLAYQYVSSKKFNRLQYLQLKKNVLKSWKDSQLMSQLNLSRTDFDRLFSGLLKVTEAIGRHWRLYQEVASIEALKTDIIKHSRVSAELADALFAQFIDSETKLSQFIIANHLAATGNRLQSIRWRIDVVISDRFLAKIMEPVVRFELVISTGGHGEPKRVNFECRLAAFHQLRFMTACLLKEMGHLEARIK